MDKKAHDTLSFRLADMLIKLNNGETLNPQQLAQGYKVSVRSIQRDLNERLGVLPLKQEQGLYRLESFYLGKLNLKDIKNFATLAGVSGLFPKLDTDFIRAILDTTISQAYDIKGQYHEDVSELKPVFQLLQTAILQHQTVKFLYKGTEHHVEPYKLIHHRGCWYLAAGHQGLLKAYKLALLQNLHTQDIFTPNQALLTQVNQEESIWFGVKKQEVILTVNKQVAAHFKRRPLIPAQQIVKELADGSLIVSSHISNELQILPIVRYWIPHIKILSPDSLREALQQSLKEFTSTY
jgi:predicted DNA-binding transcriptional regulator YafY